MEPFNIFSWGNKQTLLKNKNNEDNLKSEKLQEEVIKFWKENYDSKTMKLVVYHNINILNEVTSLFETIPSLKIENPLPNIELDYYDNNFIRRLFKPEFTNKYIYIKPLNNFRSANIYIEIPNTKLSYKNNIITYLKHIFLSSHDESLLLKYKKLGFAENLAFNLNRNLYVSYLRIKILLTEVGYLNIEKVINEFYAYLYNLKYSKKEFILYKKKFQKDYKYKEIQTGVNYTEQLASDMQYFPIKNILNHECIFKQFDALEMKGLLTIIKNYENWLVLICSNTYFNSEHKTQTEEFFKTEYFVSDNLVIKEKYQNLGIDQNIISPRMDKLHKNRQSLPFKLYTYKNHLINFTDKGLISFLTNTFYNKPKLKIFKLKDNLNKVKLIEKEHEYGRFALIYNPTYYTPKTYVLVKFNTEVTKEKYIIFNLYFKMAYETYLLKYADYSFFNTVDLKCNIKKTGIEFQFSGFTKKIIVCIFNFFDAFFNIDYDYFPLAKTYNIKTYNKISTKSLEDAIFDTLENEIYNFLPSREDLLEKIECLKLTDVVLDHKYYLQMFICSDNIHVNFTGLFDYLYSKIVPTKKYNHEHTMTNKNLDCATIDENNNAMGVFIKFKPISDINSTIALKMILHNYKGKFYNQLHVIDKLGYNVAMQENCINGIRYLCFLVESEWDCKKIENEISKFINAMKDELDKFKDDVLAKMKTSFKNRYTGDHGSLKRWFDFYKPFACYDSLDIGFLTKLVTCADSLTIEDLKLSDEMIIVNVKKMDLNDKTIVN